ncbi:lipid A biosynthesis lauroyl acyltransferase [bacterium BMS3Abin04]|nr:lipid A biosynthesis lauroyl acyltransferase [bacterium BMS3Abin04]
MNLKNRVEYFVFIIFAAFFNLFGIRNAKTSAKLLHFILYYIFPIRKDVILKNIRIAFPSNNKEENKKLISKIYYSLSITLAEVLCSQNIKKEDLDYLVKMNNPEIIDELLQRKSGAFLITAHFGNWELSGLYFAAIMGIPMYGLAKPQRNNLVSDWLNKSRSQFGNSVISLGVSIREVYKALKSNGIIGVVGDQRGPQEGLRVNFFNRQTSVYPGTAAIALKNNTPIYFFLIIRNNSFKYNIIMERINYNNFEGNNDEKIRKINEIYMSRLEYYIKKYPEQWFWMHNIWKY